MPAASPRVRPEVMLSRNWLSRIVGALMVAVLFAGCGPTSEASGPGEPAALHIVNVDGPGVSVILGGKVLAAVPCGGDASLMPGGQLPPLPWDLAVRADDGAILGSVSISGSLPLAILIRGRSVLTGSWPMSYGPAPSPLNAPCGTVTPS